MEKEVGEEDGTKTNPRKTTESQRGNENDDDVDDDDVEMWIRPKGD